MATKIIIKKTPDPDEPTSDKKPDKKIKIKVKKDNTATTSQYGMYSGIVDEKGQKDNPSETEAIKNMANYMKNNNMPESTSPSNVYRQKFTHVGVLYNRKKKQDTA